MIKRKANEWSGVFTIAAFILALLAVPVAAGKWIERLNNVEERVGEFSQGNTISMQKRFAKNARIFRNDKRRSC